MPRPKKSSGRTEPGIDPANPPVGLNILMLGSEGRTDGPIGKIMPLLASGFRSYGCRVVSTGWGKSKPREPRLLAVARLVRDIANIRRRLKSGHFDVLFVHTGHDWKTLLRDIPLALLSRRKCAVVALLLHGSFSNRLVSPGSHLFKALSRFLSWSTSIIFLLSTEELREWKKFRPQGSFSFVSNPFEDSQHSRELILPRKPLFPGETPLILYVGRLIPEKGAADIIDALEQLKGSLKCRLLIVGEGRARKLIEDRTATLQVSDQVTLAGHLEGTCLEAAYRAANLFVLPTYWKEGFPTVLAEAMSYGLPIITTPLRGAADHLEDAIHTLFVPPRTPGALADAIRRLVTDKSLYARMAAANRRKIGDFAPQVVASRYLQALHIALHKSELPASLTQQTISEAAKN